MNAILFYLIDGNSLTINHSHRIGQRVHSTGRTGITAKYPRNTTHRFAQTRTKLFIVVLPATAVESRFLPSRSEINTSSLPNVLYLFRVRFLIGPLTIRNAHPHLGGYLLFRTRRFIKPSNFHPTPRIFHTKIDSSCVSCIDKINRYSLVIFSHCQENR